LANSSVWHRDLQQPLASGNEEVEKSTLPNSQSQWRHQDVITKGDLTMGAESRAVMMPTAMSTTLPLIEILELFKA